MKRHSLINIISPTRILDHRTFTLLRFGHFAYHLPTALKLLHLDSWALHTLHPSSPLLTTGNVLDTILSKGYHLITNQNELHIKGNNIFDALVLLHFSTTSSKPWSSKPWQFLQKQLQKLWWDKQHKCLWYKVPTHNQRQAIQLPWISRIRAFLRSWK